MKLISVIIPVFNVERYIERCMQSLLNQSYKEFEALIVDDGSSDSSIELARAIVNEDPRFIFLKKKNGGQGTARNLGLDHAKGDYIAFLDSDDFYTNDTLKIAFNEIIKDSSIDVLSFGINRVDEHGLLLSKQFKDESIVDTNNDILLLNKTQTRFFWDKLYKRQVISEFRFSTEIRTYEDVDLIYQVLYKCKIKNIPNCLYNYTQRVGSTVHSLPPSFIVDKANIVNNAKFFLVDNSMFEAYEEYYNKFYLDEMIYKPLFFINDYSKNYKLDLHELSSFYNRELLSFRNIREFMSYRGSKSGLILLSFKINERLPFLIWKINDLARHIKKVLRK